MAQLYSFQIRGLTAGGATINTVAVSYDSDGFVRFTDLTGRPRSVMVANNGDEGMSALLKMIFTGASGFDAGSAGVQGHRVFAEPSLIQ